MSVHVIDGTRPSTRRTTRVPPRFDLSLSENPFPPLPSVLRAVHMTLAQANRYPEFLPRRLPTLIAGHVGVRAEQIVVGSGATGVALQIMQTLTTPGAEIVYSSPTFDGYPIMAEMTGLTAVPVPLDPTGKQDLRAMRRAINRRTALVVVCRPHNPTGTVIPADELKAFLSDVPTRVPVILDEAYVEFLGAAEHADPLALIAKHPDLLIVRTFSKAYGLAGLRIGYAVGRAELIARVNRLQLPFGVGAAAVAAVAASYAAEPELAARTLRITEQRDALRGALLARGYAIPESHANFLYVPGPGATTALRRAGIAAKSYPDGSARIAVGDLSADHAVLQALSTRTP
ncbi:aminotransferase class I/II-fold pyridoxal phosphate-dependent enzyme [Streptomyces gardneri]|uniref:aminotransferase class I/II-fold pyridoxal phosphate-dependent enzyme n=1 Tax=Nocardia TaxID=1817 RepID=UPI001358F165|nr:MULTISPECIES: aminotransferase class I/II-fold pyridoxal phosphate-dependent enzyme [Nocardia]MBF6164218.1 aminotransferase class I/II-fold pyridoxal phosphate-dependent enzyme [Streptomyces gardneri]UAK33831.1 aminotransferase class I/II-fold pyridoxal phosphate-dependent enzyme [Nocardia asteroides]